MKYVSQYFNVCATSEDKIESFMKLQRHTPLNNSFATRFKFTD